MNAKLLCALFAGAVLAAPVWGKTVKITPLGSHQGEFCATDRAFLFEDPTGVRILYDVGASVAGATDPRLGEVHAVLLSHAHSDHIGGNKAAGLDAGTCAKPETISAAPHSNTAEIAAAKNAAVITGNDVAMFLGRKIQTIRGSEIANCPETGLARVTTVPTSAPCVGGLQLGGKRTLAASGQSRGVEVFVVYAVHSHAVPRALLSEQERASLTPDNLNAFVGHANGYILAFTNGLKVYLSGDTAMFGDMKAVIRDFYRVHLAVLNLGRTTMPSAEAAYVANTMIRPAAVIPSHSSEQATSGGKLRPGSRTEEFVKLVKGPRVHVPLSGKTMEFDARAKCVAGC